MSIPLFLHGQCGCHHTPLRAGTAAFKNTHAGHRVCAEIPGCACRCPAPLTLCQGTATGHPGVSGQMWACPIGEWYEEVPAGCVRSPADPNLQNTAVSVIPNLHRKWELVMITSLGCFHWEMAKACLLQKVFEEQKEGAG